MALPATQNAYVYSPMTSPTSVRFMKLLPGSGESPIDCEIFEARIEDHLPYIALSYSWGSQKDLRKISCSGTRSLEVTPNLYQALRHLRHPTELRTFWIDALCVDQKNIQERNHQVAQMKQIYSQSQKLLIWLGTSSSNLAYDLITRLAALVDNPEQPGVFQPQPWIQSQHWKALSELLTSEWFRRMWVVQELVLGLRMNEPFATEVLFGSHLVTWSELARCCGYIGRHYAQLFESSTHTADSGIIRRGVTRVDNLHGMAIRAPQDLTYSEWMVWLLKKLTTSRNKKTSDPRDKVFALYGLCCSEPQPLPDYALSPAEVYRMYAVETIRATRSLAILSQVEVRSKSSEITVPSWVPDWSVGLERYNTLRDEDLLNSVGLLAVPGDFTFLEVNNAADPNILHLTTNIADHVVYVGGEISRDHVEDLYSGRKSWVSTLWKSVENSQYLDGTRDSQRPYSRTSHPGRSNDHEGGLKGLRARLSKLTFLPNRNKKQPQEQEEYNKDEARFGKFIRTLIAYVKIPGLEILIESGETRFLDLLIWTAKNQTRPRRFSTGRTVSLLIEDGENGQVSPPALDNSLTTEISGSSSSSFTGSGKLPLRFTKAEQSLMETYLSVLHEWTHSKRFFITKRGYMGCGIKRIRTGDQIAVLSAYGNPGRSLFSIRQAGVRFNFIGEAYVHGLKFDEEANKMWREIELE